MRYWHFTRDPNFSVDAGFTPRSRIMGVPSPMPMLWVTDDPWAWYRAWAEPQGYGYVAEVEVPSSARTRTRHSPPDPPETAVFDVDQVRVVNVQPVMQSMPHWPNSMWKYLSVEVEDWQKQGVRSQWQRLAMAWTLGPDASDRCTQSVLMQFGIMDECPKDGLALLDVLQRHGWTYVHVEVDGQPFRGTVKQFYERFKEGKYYFATNGHAMAMIDGLLIDSAGRGPDGRKVIGAFEVYRKGEKPVHRDIDKPIRLKVPTWP